MDVVSLPLVTKKSSVKFCIAELKRHSRAGIVVDNGDNFTLVYAGELLAAHAGRLETVAEIPGGTSICVVTRKEAQTHKLDLVRPLVTKMQYREYFNVINPDFAVVGAANGITMLITRSEEFAEILQAPGGFQCTGRPRHYFPLPRVSLGQRCPMGGHKPKPGGNRPVIVLAP